MQGEFSFAKFLKSSQSYGSSFIFFSHFCSVVEYVRIVVHVRPVQEHLQDGITITPFVIRATSNATKDLRVPSVIELIEQPPIERWSSVAYAISKKSFRCRCYYSF